ncbi:MAG: glycoside hydrolase family 75 protein [Verrucomicrobia bacterium]|nr:glycoside hydrolase family 75 protein [Verrucomicrobiota bacterium]
MKARSSLIAEKDPFIVLSLLFRGYSGTNKYTPQMGDYAVVIYGDKMYPAICGDYGPTQKMGEASLFMAKAISDKATPYRRPESDLKITYLIFPGTAEKPNAPPNLDHWHEKCSAYLKEIGAPGPGRELHRWKDPFKKPELPVTVLPAAGAAAAPGSPTTVPTVAPTTPPPTPPPAVPRTN